MTKHTPGPWLCEPDLEPMGGCLSRAVMGPETFIAYALLDDEDDLVGEANARLMAAAPELLEAATTVLAGLNERIEIAARIGDPAPVFAGIADLHTAIQKARATPQTPGSDHG